MLSSEDRKMLAEFERGLTPIVTVKKLCAFGSRVRDDAAPDSDLDVFIEVEVCTPQQRRQISEIAWEVGFEWDRIISPVVVTTDQLQNGAMGASPLIRNIEREGVFV